MGIFLGTCENLISPLLATLPLSDIPISNLQFYILVFSAHFCFVLLCLKMTSYDEELKAFALELFKIDAIKFGEYKTKVGLMTPIYCDLRIIISYPKLMESLANLIIKCTKNLSLDIICGVPYTALPIATTVSIKAGVPMVMRRKEAKEYGTKKIIEGNYQAGDCCLIIEDVVTSGSSILETVKDLRNAGIKTTDTVVLLNREQGGEQILKENGIKMHALLNMTRLLDILREANCIDYTTCDKVLSYLEKSQITSDVLKDDSKNRLKMKFEERITHTKNPVGKKLFEIMFKKQTNLCVAADLIESTAILNLAEQIGPYICLFKTHIDIVQDFSLNFIKQLKDIAKRHNFVLFEDRKFADIGKTVQLQYSKGVYQISSWAEIVTVHSLMGKGILDALEQSEGAEERGVFLLAEASSAGSLINETYIKSTLKLATDYPNLITGIVCQSPLLLESPGFIQLTPGVQLDINGDGLGQQYSTPEMVILDKGADIAVVGRGITKSAEPVLTAEKYKNLLWEAYIKRIQ